MNYLLFIICHANNYTTYLIFELHLKNKRTITYPWRTEINQDRGSMVAHQQAFVARGAGHCAIFLWFQRCAAEDLRYCHL